METYKPWDFCKSIDCLAIKRSEEVNQSEEARKQSCMSCKAYKMHQYLREHGQILEEESVLAAQFAGAKADNEVLSDLIIDLQSQLAEAQADNAALVEACQEIMSITDQYILRACGAAGGMKKLDAYEVSNKLMEIQSKAGPPLADPHPGDPIRKELEQYKRALEAIKNQKCPEFYTRDGRCLNAIKNCFECMAEGHLAQAKAVE